jgi:hypothetical protein
LAYFLATAYSRHILLFAAYFINLIFYKTYETNSVALDSLLETKDFCFETDTLNETKL